MFKIIFSLILSMQCSFVDAGPVRGKIAPQSMEQIQAQDAKSWTNTLFPNKRAYQIFPYGVLVTEFQKIDFMRRVFLTMVVLNLSYTPEKNNRERLKPWPYALATALSHGQRVLFDGTGISSQQLINLWSGNKTSAVPAWMYVRTFASHGTAWNKKRQEIDEIKLGGVRGFVKQVGQVAGRAAGNAYHYGMDIPAGGMGATNPLGDLVGPGGRSFNRQTLNPRRGIQYGHVYIGPSDFKFSSGIRSGVLVGVEVEAPGNQGPFGNNHNFSSGFRSSTEEQSLWGSVKMQKFPVPAEMIPAKYGGMMVSVYHEDLPYLNKLFKAILLLPKKEQSNFFMKLLSAPNVDKAYGILATQLENMGEVDVAQYFDSVRQGI